MAGEFTINDIVLDIPPEFIQVTKEAVNHRWQTLRTRSSTKQKSGLSEVRVELRIPFTDNLYDIDPSLNPSLTINSIQKLRHLVSQFRVTPICYVDNEYLRTTIIPGTSGINMALILRQMVISTDEQYPGLIWVQLSFNWFNYLPFSKRFTFNRDVGALNDEVYTPSDSKAWKMLYAAEQQRTTYIDVKELGTQTLLTLNEFAILPLSQFQKVEASLKKLKQEIDKATGSYIVTGNNDMSNLRSATKQLQDSLKDEGSSVLGTGTSFGSDKNRDELDELVNSVNRGLTTIETLNAAQSLFNRADVWKPIKGVDGKEIFLRGKTLGQVTDKPSANDGILVRRKLVFNLDDLGLIVNRITISFSNIVATLPIIGYMYPTYQHIGNIDSTVTLDIVTTNLNSVEVLNSVYTLLEEQTIKNRQLPEGLRNLMLSNDLVNMCGLKEFVVEEISNSTIPHQPETYGIQLTLVDNPIESITREKFERAQSFTTTNTLRTILARCITRFLTFDDSSIINVVGRKLLPELSPLGEELDFAVGAKLKVSSDIEEQSLIQRPRDTYYQYTGSNDERHLLFKSTVRKYSSGLSEIIHKCVKTVRDNPIPEVFAELYSFSDSDIPSIEKIQEDLLPFIQNVVGNPSNKDKQGLNEFVNLGNELSKARKVSVSSPEQIQEDINNVRSKYRDLLIQNNKSGVLNSILDEWKSFSTRFLDDLSNNTYITDLPEFEEYNKTVKERTIRGGINCYPDFPLDQVINLMRQDPEGTYKFVLDELERISITEQFGFKNINVNALVEPDFYLFNSQKDSGREILGDNAIQAASENIKTAHDSFLKSETDYFKKIHDKQILGTNKVQHMNALVNSSFRPGEKDNRKKKDTSKAEAKELEASNQKVTRDYRDNGTFPPSATGTLMPGLAQIRESNSQTQLPILQKAANACFLSAPFSSTDTDLGSKFLRYSKLPTSQYSIGSAQYAHEMKHRLDIDDIFRILPESEYINPKMDTSNTPNFRYPIPSYARRITSPFGERNAVTTVNSDTGLEDKSSSNHKGIDFGGMNGPAPGAEVYAAADGEITSVTYSMSKQRPNMNVLGHQGVSITITHKGGYQTKYFHMQWDEPTKTISDVFYKRFPYDTLNEEQRKAYLTVPAGRVIGLIGSTGGVKGPHLHFEIWKDGNPLDPELILNGDSIPSRFPPLAVNPESESLFSKSVDQFLREMNSGQGYSMIRAYPTFKLYFIESDIGERKYFSFDDFYSYSAVQSIKVVRSRKIAADLALITLTNVSGVLTNRKFVDKNADIVHDVNGQDVTENPQKSQTANTEAENPIYSLMLKVGTEVQLRLGYSNNPDNLETVLNGIITSVELNDSDDLLTIAVQSHAVELVQNVYGAVKDIGGFLSNGGDTIHVLEEVLSAPECVHFGLWEPGSGQSTNSDLVELLTNRWQIRRNPKIDNLWAPDSGPTSLIRSSAEYTFYNTTGWDVIQEMTMRHPGFVASVVPYEDYFGPRVTLFFGLPDQLYACRDPSKREQSIAKKMKDLIDAENVDRSKESLAKELAESSKSPKADILEYLRRDLTRDAEKIKRLRKEFAMDAGWLRPFRSYHVATSSMHIIANSIKNSAHNTFNTATVLYENDSPDANEETQNLEFDDMRSFTLPADAALQDDEKKEIIVRYPNCVGPEMAKFYAVSTLFNSLKDAYRGHLVLIGNPKIKPYDIIYIFDEYTDMFGPVEVEEVIHTFDQEHGFITEVVPNLLVHVNQHSTLGTSAAMSLIVEDNLKKIGIPGGDAALGAAAFTGLTAAAAIGGLAAAAPVAAGLAVAGALSYYTYGALSYLFFNGEEHSLGVAGSTDLFSAIGVLFFRSAVTRTQLAHPLRFSVLTLHGKPMVGGLPNQRLDLGMFGDIKRFIRDAQRDLPLYFSEFYDKISPNNLINPQGNFFE